MESITEKKLKEEMVFHLFGRFAPIRNIININRKNLNKFSILDVGGRGNWMKEFFPNDDVFYLDPNIDSNDKNFIKGDGCNIPFDNDHFDWVVSTDVFEHIPEEKRRKFLEENCRVSKLGVILVAPFWSEAVELAEFNANENYKLLHKGADHIWLKEHIENGLPDMNKFEKILEENNFKFQKLYNNRLFLWQMLLGVEFLIETNCDETLDKQLKEFNYFYNSQIFPYDNQEPSYRKIYFIKKKSFLEDVSVNYKSIGDTLFLDVFKRSIDLIVKIDNKNKKNIEIKNHKVFIKGQEIKKKDRIIKQKDQEIETMKSSKFWKLREKYLKLKSNF